MTTKQATAIAAMLLSLLVGQRAQAFYSPSPGRWLSRDPLGEASFLMAYTQGMPPTQVQRLVHSGLLLPYSFAGNDPTDKIDGQGLVVVPAVVVAVVATYAACMTPHFITGMNKYPNDEEMRHCWTSCSAARTCGAMISAVSGIGFELYTEALSTIWPNRTPDWENSLYDLSNNVEGLGCAGWESGISPAISNLTRCFRESCEDCCKRKYGRL